MNESADLDLLGELFPNFWDLLNKIILECFLIKKLLMLGANKNELYFKVDPPITRLFGLNTADEKPGSCLVYTNYAFDVGIMQQSTLKRMEANPLPAFGKISVHRKCRLPFLIHMYVENSYSIET